MTRTIFSSFVLAIGLISSASAEVGRLEHNGSLMAYTVMGNRLIIQYAEPRPGLVRSGIVRGMTLFDGYVVPNGMIYGNAFTFSPGCQPAPYPVRGTMRAQKIVLEGAVPVRLAFDCRVFGYRTDSANARLAFSTVNRQASPAKVTTLPAVRAAAVPSAGATVAGDLRCSPTHPELCDQASVSNERRENDAEAVATQHVGNLARAETKYSTTNGSRCIQVDNKDEFASWRCPGPAGYGAHFFDEGNMVAIEFGPSGREKTLVDGDLSWRGGDKPFGDRIEWRVTGSKPFAAVVRIQRRDDSDESNGGTGIVDELLLVRISPQGACRIGTIDGRKSDANDIARNLMDASAGFRCGIDKPRVIDSSSLN